jgi:ribose transport system ATP-binding protein
MFGRFLVRRGTGALLGDELAAVAEGGGDGENSTRPVLSNASRASALRSGAGHGAVTASMSDSRGAPVLMLRGIAKRFAAVQAVDDVELDCYGGEVHAVVGENGSGKSTLLGVACGVVQPDAGSVEIGGQGLSSASTAEATKLGVGMTYQTYSQVLDMTIAENLYLAARAEDRPPYGQMVPWAAAHLGELGIELNASTLAGNLTLAERQFLEVAKALLTKPKVLLLDEPTTALGPGDIERLHALVAERVAAGVGVVYVSHRLPEVLGLAHRVTVLRDGVSQGTFDATALSEGELVALMIGRPVQLAFPESNGEGASTDVQLDIAALRAERFGPIDLRLRAGEIVGIAGAEGNGQAQFVRSLAGVERATGAVRSGSRRLNLRSPRRALAGGVILLSDDRRRESLFPVLGIRANATIQVLARFSRLGWLRRGRERAAVLDLARRLQIRAASVEQPVLFLSGGNQQKVALMRPFLRHGLKVIIAVEPTQGVDVRSRFDIYQALREKAMEGGAVLIKSSDPLELSGLCDRVIVMSRGQVIDEISSAELVPAAEVGERRIIEAIVGSGAALVSAAAADGATPAHAPKRDTLTEGAQVTHDGRADRPRRLRIRYGNWVSVAFVAFLVAAVSAYTASKSSAFSGSFNLNGLFIAVIPLALVSMGQLNAMLVGGFDVSVGAIMTLCVVIASFTVGVSEDWWELLLGTLAVLVLAIGAGVFNATLIRVGKLTPIIATLATLSIFQGVALALRPVPAGPINTDFVNIMTKGVGPVPIAFIAVVVVAAAWDVWLYRSSQGLAVRAVGLDEGSARRSGARSGYIFVRGFLLSAFMAGVASLFLAAQIGIGDPNSGLSFALTSIAAAVLGGATLTGGRGSFVGAVLASLFLVLIINILPFLNISSAYGQIAVGALILIALCVQRGPAFANFLRDTLDDLRGARAHTR